MKIKTGSSNSNTPAKFIDFNDQSNMSSNRLMHYVGTNQNNISQPDVTNFHNAEGGGR